MIKPPVDVGAVAAEVENAFRKMPPVEDVPAPSDDDAPLDMQEFRDRKNAMTADELTILLRKDRAAWAADDVFFRIMAQQDASEIERIRLVAVDNKFITKFEARAKKYLAEKRRKSGANMCAGKEILSLIEARGRPENYSGNPRVPVGYAIFNSENGVKALFRLEKRIRKEVEVIIPVHVIDRIPIVTASFVDPSGQYMLEVQWPKSAGGWQCVNAPAGHVTSTRHMLETFGPYLFPGNSHNATDLARWFSAYLDENSSEIPMRKTSSQGGWQDNGGFLLGDKFIAKEGTEEIHFASLGDGESDVLRGLAARKGTMDGWRKAVTAVHGHWALEMGLYASLAAPLQKIIGAANPIFEWAGPTSRGKTTAMRLGASVWGENAEGASYSLIETWNLTQTALEFIQGAMCDLPTFIDDTQLASNRDGKNSFLQSAIHQVSEGRGRVRGAKDGGIRSTTKFRTFLCTTSENKMSDVLSGQGAGARIVSSYGSPCGDMSASEVNSITSSVAENCGHAGEIFIRFLVDNEDRWPEFRNTYFELQERYTAKLAQVKNKGVLGRQIKSLALLGLAARLAVDVLDLPWGTDERDPVEEFLGIEFESDLGEASKPEEVLRTLASSIGSSIVRLEGTIENEAAKGTFYGELFGRVKDGFFDLHTKVVEQIIRSTGQDPRSMLRQWAASGILKRPNNHQSLCSQARVLGVSSPVYRFPAETFPLKIE